MSLIKLNTSSEDISSNGGFSFVSGILDALPEMRLWDTLLPCHCNARLIVRSAIGLMTAECYDYADVREIP